MTVAADRPGPPEPGPTPGLRSYRPSHSFARLPRQLRQLATAVPETHGWLLVLCAFLFFILSVLLVFGIGPPSRPPASTAAVAEEVAPTEVDLQESIAAPNLNSTSAEAPAAAPAPAPQVEIRPPDEPPQLRADAPGSVTAPPGYNVPVVEIPEYLRYSQRGETPMMRTWKQLGLPAILAASFAASPSAQALAQASEDKADAILKELKEVKKTLQELEQLRELPKSLTELERKISDKLQNLEMDTRLRTEAFQRDLGALKDQYGLLRQEIEALRGRPPTGKPSTSLYPPAAPPAGRLRLVNTWVDTVSVVVNNTQTYRIPPGGEAFVESVPAGNFTYEVLGIQGRVSRSLAPGETYSIHVYPR